MNNFVKQAYVQGLAARAILRARMMSKQAKEEPSPYSVPGGQDAIKAMQAGAAADERNNALKAYGLYGGIGAGSGALIGALINYARKKNVLQGALVGGGLGGLAGLGSAAINRNVLNKKVNDESELTGSDWLDAADAQVNFNGKQEGEFKNNTIPNGQGGVTYAGIMA